MFTKQQLNVLIHAESGDDWTPEYFVERLPEVAEQSNISGAEFDNLMNWISSLSREQIYTLQIVLMGLLDLPAYRDTFEV